LNLVAAYQFEATGTDTTANAYDLTNNGATYTAGLVGLSATMNGTAAQNLSRADTDSLDLIGDEWTVSLWTFNNAWPAEGYSMPVGKVANLFIAGERQWIIFRDAAAGKWGLLLDSGGTQTTFNATSHSGTRLGSWYNIIASYARGTYSIYINDSTKDSLRSPRKIQNATRVFRIGSDNTNNGTSTNGRVDQVFIWRRELSAAERTFIYNSRLGRSYSEIIGYTP
jgi:hypothetical protein